MTRISCAQGRWRIDGHPFLVICGEIDYFRVHRNNWADRLGRLKANGANAVATYIPWLLHEPVEGRFDFTTYDLAAFIDACAVAGLWLIVRPGPYIYSELVCDGLPQWLWADYPALRAKRHDGTDAARSATRIPTISHMPHAGMRRCCRCWCRGRRITAVRSWPCRSTTNCSASAAMIAMRPASASADPPGAGRKS